MLRMRCLLFLHAGLVAGNPILTCPTSPTLGARAQWHPLPLRVIRAPSASISHPQTQASRSFIVEARADGAPAVFGVRPRKDPWLGRRILAWAPHVIFDDASGRFFMYYSTCLNLHVAVADSLGPFTDMGRLIRFAIDPFVMRDPASKTLILYW